MLEALFSKEEVNELVWNNDDDKSPGSNGSNIGFFKACWKVVIDDVFDFMNEFHSVGKFPKAVTTSFLTLIHKVNHTGSLEDYRPIFLIGSLFIILAKFISARLRLLIGKLISSCQSSFVPNRNMMDRVLVINEIMVFTKKNKRG